MEPSRSHARSLDLGLVVGVLILALAAAAIWAGVSLAGGSGSGPAQSGGTAPPSNRAAEFAQQSQELPQQAPNRRNCPGHGNGNSGRSGSQASALDL
jgi:hypothetical protein